MASHQDDVRAALATIFSELADGASPGAEAYVLNPGDAGLLGSLDRLNAGDASAASDGGATIAAHAEHLRYGLSLMNRWAAEGGNPFAGARWDEAWKTTAVDDRQWAEIRAGLRAEATRWGSQLGVPRDATPVELNGIVGSIAHLGYHLGAIRQITKRARGPREGAT